MAKIKIGIVEDEMIIAETIVLALEKLGYEVVGTVGDYKKAIEMIDKTAPDLVVLDINLGTKKDGIDLALEIKERFNTAIIFLTANSDTATIDRAKEINPLAFIVKPFSQIDLFSAIEIGWNNYNSNAQRVSKALSHIVLKAGSAFEKVAFDDILYLKNEQNYIMFFLVSGKVLPIRSSTNEILKSLPIPQFIKINRSYIINIKHVKKIDAKVVYLDAIPLPIAKSAREELLLIFYNFIGK